MATRKNTPAARSSKLSAHPTRELSECVKRLELVLAIITVAAAALEYQNADIDSDIGTALSRGAAHPLSVEIERLVAFIDKARS